FSHHRFLDSYPPSADQGFALGAGWRKGFFWRYSSSSLMLLCHLRGYPLWHAHELTQQRLLGRFEPEPVADLAMHLRQGHASPVRPRGKKPAAGAPGGLAPAAAAIRARPGSCT